MHFNRIRAGAVAALWSAMALCAAAQTPPAAPAALGARYQALQDSGGTAFAIDPSRSSIRIYVFRGGRAAQFGHNHVVSAPEFEGYFHMPKAGLSDARFDLAFRLDRLEVDRPEHRAQTGGSFGTVLSESATQGTRDNMLGEFGLQAAQFPWLRIRSLQITGESPKFAALMAVELHGQTREIWVPLQVSGLPEQLTVQGATVLRQTDFGLKPYSLLGGLLAVQDALVVEFTLLGQPLALPAPAQVQEQPAQNK